MPDQHLAFSDLTDPDYKVSHKAPRMKNNKNKSNVLICSNQLIINKQIFCVNICGIKNDNCG